MLIYDDFRADNEATVATVLRFLDVDETYPIAPEQVNPTLRMRSQNLDELVHAVSVGHGPISRAARATVKTIAPKRLRREALELARRRLVYGEPRPPDEALMRQLRQRFRGEVEALSDYLGRDLVTFWGYDELD